MAPTEAITGEASRRAHFTIRKISTTDLVAAIENGIGDFANMPSHVLFLSLIYPVAGLIIGRLIFGYDMLPLVFPLVAGFALLGPLAAIGLYELSRRREHGLSTTWKDAFRVLQSRAMPGIATLGALLLAIFIGWLATAQLIYDIVFQNAPQQSVTRFLGEVLTTPAGWTLIAIGNLVGLLFAIVAFSISVISFPLMLDREVGFAGAVATSVEAVLKNPLVMALWGLIVVAGLVIGSIPFLLGLTVAMPILGHSTWHLYRRTIETDHSPRVEKAPRPRTKRYAAEFPSVLFPWTR